MPQPTESDDLPTDVTGDPDRLVAVAAAFGRARSSAGCTMPEMFDDLEALFDSSPSLSAADRWSMARASAEAWSDLAVAATIGAPFVDALSGLPTAGYLLARAREHYADDGRLSPRASTRLAVVGLGGSTSASPAASLGLARRLPHLVGPRCVVAKLGRDALAVLVADRHNDVDRLLVWAASESVQVTLEPLPTSFGDLEARVVALCAGS